MELQRKFSFQHHRYSGIHEFFAIYESPNNLVSLNSRRSVHEQMYILVTKQDWNYRGDFEQDLVHCVLRIFCYAAHRELGERHIGYSSSSEKIKPAYPYYRIHAF